MKILFVFFEILSWQQALPLTPASLTLCDSAAATAVQMY